MDKELLESLLEEVPGGARVEELWVYRHWVVVETSGWGMASIPAPDGSTLLPGRSDLAGFVGSPVREAVRELMASDEPVHRSAAVACLNAALPVPRGLVEGNALHHFQAKARQMKTAVIGHFDEAAAWRDAGWPVSIIELVPRHGDIHWDDSREVLAAAELVLVTGLTLQNGTFDEVLRRTPHARLRVLMGPSVPLSPKLLARVDVLGGTVISDPPLLLKYFQRGGTTIRRTPPGAIRRVNWASNPGLLEVA